MIDDRNWPRTFDTIDEYYWNSFSMTNIPLAYVTREHVEPMEGEEDNWDHCLDPMIDQETHFIPQVGANPTRQPTFIVDNKTVFDKLAEMNRNYACWLYVKPFLHSRNGQAAYISFLNHYQRPSKPIRMIWENFPRSALVPQIRLTSLDSGSLQNGCPLQCGPFHPNGLHKSSCQYNH